MITSINPGRRGGIPPSRNAGSCAVVVIDDDELTGMMMVDLLQNAGCEAKALDSPIGASRELVALGAHVVVLDVSMPSMSGDRLATVLKQNPKLKNLGIVFVTSDQSTMPASLPPELTGAPLVLKKDLETKLVSAVKSACRAGCHAPPTTSRRRW